MEKLFESLNQVLLKVEVEIGNENARESKTLLNTYRTLLNLVDFSDSNLTVEFYSFMNEHHTQVTGLRNEIHRFIKTSLEITDYRETDEWATVLERLNKSAEILEFFIKKYKNYVKNISVNLDHINKDKN